MSTETSSSIRELISWAIQKFSFGDDPCAREDAVREIVGRLTGEDRERIVNKYVHDLLVTELSQQRRNTLSNPPDVRGLNDSERDAVIAQRRAVARQRASQAYSRSSAISFSQKRVDEILSTTVNINGTDVKLGDLTRTDLMNEIDKRRAIAAGNLKWASYFERVLHRVNSWKVEYVRELPGDVVESLDVA